jgi:DUF4097 and DUF4098 domain-containing protein YvlB
MLVLAGCEDFDIGGFTQRYKEDFHFSYPLAEGGRIELENFNGSVEISGWDQNTVDIDGTKYASTENRLREMKIDVRPSAGSVMIRTVPPIDRHGNAGARYIVRVPRHAELANIVTSNGPIRVTDMDGAAHLRTSNGGVRLSDIHGLVDARTSNGGVELDNVVGDATLHTTNGSIHADVKKGRFEATTSNGSITARLMEPDQSPVRLESSNGHIDLTMDAPREVHASTSNSSITVHMPPAVGATVHAHTTNASISSDFDVSVHGGRLSRHQMDGTIGAGGPLLDLSTSNGAIRLTRL